LPSFLERADELKERAGMNEPPRHNPDGPPDVPDHEMGRLIGRGSYGEVWLARNAVGTWRAVKVVYRARFKDARPYEREFLGIQKYEPISRSNEGLVDVLQIGRNEAAGYFYYVMELADDAGPRRKKKPIDGHAQTTHVADPDLYVPRTLTLDLIRRGRLSMEECVTLGLSLNLALGHLHRNGLIHRDVKPPNVIFVNGVPKLADIGLVVEMSGAHSYVGTEGYIAPEGPNSPQADVYAMGKLLYEASTGNDRHEFPKLPADLDTEVDAGGLKELVTVVQRACAPDPKERYRSAEEMNADLALVHSGKSVQWRCWCWPFFRITSPSKKPGKKPHNENGRRPVRKKPGKPGPAKPGRAPSRSSVSTTRCWVKRGPRALPAASATGTKFSRSSNKRARSTCHRKTWPSCTAKQGPVLAISRA
jgi:serine/threonine protein kinase